MAAICAFETFKRRLESRVKRTFRIPAVASGLPGMAGALLHLEFRTTGCMHDETETTKSSRRFSGGASRCFELLSAFRDASDAEAGSLRLMPDPTRTYALAAFCAASNTSRADVVAATCSVPSTPRSIHPAFTA